jgi:probable F420-dependent oxidoreductase
MQFWQSLAFTEPEQLIPTARIAEEVGFEGVLLSDHLFFPGRLESRYPYAEDGRPGFDGATPFPDPWATISAMAAVTDRLRFATLVYILPLRHPLEVAKSVGTAAVLSGDRVVLGTGAGWIREEFETLGVPFETRGRRYDEAIDVLRKVWTGRPVEHRGEHFPFDTLQMSPAPAKPVPLWVGGLSRPALRRAAQRGDGWIGTGQTPDEAAGFLEELARLRREAGRADEPFDALVPLTTPPEPDSLARLADRGLTGTVSYPFTYSVGAGSSLDQKRAYLEDFAESVIRPLAG